jgi:hypothetical protein
MAVIFEFPLLNPLKAIYQSDKLPNNLGNIVLNSFNPSYNNKYMDSDFYAKTLKDYQDKKYYCQIFQQSQTVLLQFYSSVGTLSTFQFARFLDDKGNVFTQKTVTVALESGTYYGMYLYTVRIKLFDMPEGIYFLQLIHDNVSTSETAIFEPIDIKQHHPNSIQIDYYNTYNTQSFIFVDSSYVPQIRIKANITENTSSAFRTYEDQNYNVESISGTAWREYELNTRPIPMWEKDKLERITLLNSNKYDGKLLTRPEGAKIEPKNSDEVNPLTQYTLALRDKENNNTLIIGNTNLILGDMPQTTNFWVERIRIAGSYLNIRLGFSGKRNFLDYLNSTLQTANGYWSEDANNKLTFTANAGYTITGAWDITDSDVLKYSIRIGLIGAGDIEMEIAQATTGEFYAVTYGDGFTSVNKTAIATSPSTTTVAKTYTANGLRDFTIYFSNAKSIVDSATNIDARYIGGDLPPAFTDFSPFSGGMLVTEMRNNMFKYVTALENVLLPANFDMYGVNQLILYVYDTLNNFDASGVADISGQALGTGPSISDPALSSIMAVIKSQITLQTD